MIDTKVYNERGIRYRQMVCPEGYTIIDEYVPHHSVTPWDLYGLKHQQEYAKVLIAAGIVPQLLTTHRTRLWPIGSGPGGRVRCGDDMLPGVYSIAVLQSDVAYARQAITSHELEIQQWLAGLTAMPLACRNF